MRWIRSLVDLAHRARARPAGRGGTAEQTSPTALAAEAATRCAALLRGGVLPARAVAVLAREAPCAETREVAARVARGESVGRSCAAVDDPAWRVLGAAWLLAEQSGAPVAPVLDRIAHALRGVAELARRREVLLAAPRMTIKLVAWLPLAAVGVAFLLGCDPLPVFVTPFGAALVTVGLLLQAVGVRWAGRLTARVEAADRVAGLECELVWIALGGGAPPGLARVRVADAVAETQAEWIGYDSLREDRPLSRALAGAVAAGVPAAPLLLDAASEQRAATHARLEREAERLGVRVLVPLAVCVLPAFLALGVVPVIATLVGELLPL